MLKVSTLVDSSLDVFQFDGVLLPCTTVNPSTSAGVEEEEELRERLLVILLKKLDMFER